MQLQVNASWVRSESVLDKELEYRSQISAAIWLGGWLFMPEISWT